MSTQELNKNIYEKMSEIEEECSLSENLIDFLFAKGRIDEYGYFKEGKPSSDWHQPDEPLEFEMGFTMRVTIPQLEKEFGELSLDDIQNLKHLLSEDDELKESFKSYLEGLKPDEVDYFTFNVETTIKKDTLNIEVAVDEFETRV